MNTEQQILQDSQYDGDAFRTKALTQLIEVYEQTGPIVFISPNRSVVVSVTGLYFNLYTWNRRKNTYECQEVQGTDGYTSWYDASLRDLQNAAKELYIYFMQSWFDITIDPNTLDD